MRCVVAAALVCATAACGQAARDPNQPIVIAMANGPTNLDSGVGLDESSQKIHQLLYRSLLKINDDLQVVPDLAVRFEARDPQTYEAEIPPGVLFHDGREMTSLDVVYTFRRFLDPSFSSGRKGAYRNLAAVYAENRYTVSFHLREPSASFPINLVMGIVPDGTGPAAARQPIGSGPYRLAEFVPDDHVTLAPFTRAYGGAPRNAGLLFRVVPDDTMRGLELRKGSVDLVINDLSPDVVFGLEHVSGLNVGIGPGTDYAYLGFNLRDPVLANELVRRAIGYAIDVGSIVNYLRRSLASPATGIVPEMSWAYASDVFRFTYDPDKARQLLDEAGYRDPDGAGPGVRLHLTLKTSTDERYRLQAAVIQENLRAVGIALDVRSSEFATLMADVIKGNMQLYTLQFVGVTDPDMLRRAFYSTQTPPDGFNRGHYDNPAVDRAIDEAGAATDFDTRRAAYQRAQRLIASDAPVISLWYKRNVFVAQGSLENVNLSPTADFTFLKNVSRRDIR